MAAEADQVMRAQRGDEASRAALARAWLPVAYGVALAATRRPADAEDVTQEAFLRVFRHLGSLRDPGRFGPWLLQIVRNAANDRHRRRAPVNTLGHADRSIPARAGEPRNAARATVRAWHDLQEDQRLVCWLKIVDGMTFREIALLLDTSKSAVDRAYRKGVARMRRDVARC